MNKRTVIFLFSTIFVIVFLWAGFTIIRQVYAGLLEGLINQYEHEELIVAKQTANILEAEISSTTEKLLLIAQLPEIQEGNQNICNSKLHEIAELNTRISNIGRVGIDKKFRCSLNKVLVGTDAEKLGPYISKIFNDPQHKPVVSRILKVPNGGYAVAIHVPVFDAKGVFAGTVGGAIYFDEFAEKFLHNVKISTKGDIALQDDDGTIFYHQRKELIGTNITPKNPQEEATASALTKATIKSVQNGIDGTVRFVSPLDQEEKVAAYAVSNVLDDRNWLVVVTVPIEDIQARDLVIKAQYAFWQLFLLVTAAIIIPPILLLVYLNFSIFRPLILIGKAASRVGEGHLDVEIPIKSSDEIGTLAGFFNKMVLKLRNSYQNLEGKVKEKTVELTEKIATLEKNKKEILSLLEDLKVQKEQLQEKDKQLAKAQQAGSVGSFIWDLTTDIITISDETYRLYGLPPQGGKISSKEFLGMVYEDDKVGLKIKLDEGMQSKAPFEIVYRTVLTNSNMRWLKAKAKTVFSPTDEPLQIIGTVQDITKEYEVDKAKSEFVSLASHQLRTPLSAINWYTEMLLAGDAGEIGEEQRKYLLEVYSANKRMVDLVNSLLNVSRIDLGTAVVEPVPTDVVKIIKSVIEELRPQIVMQKQTVNENYESIPEMNLDPKLFRMIVQNLASNAVKYTPENGTIDIIAKVVNQDLQIIVKDTGCGIPEDQKDKIFTKLFRADNVRAKDMEGTGLGLYIIKSVLEHTGGNVWFESTENKGTTFFVSIPMTGMRKNEGTKRLS